MPHTSHSEPTFALADSQPCWGNAPHYQEAEAQVTVLSADLSADFVSPVHDHARGQLIYAPKGIIMANVDGKSWVLSPTRAAWVTPSAPHSIACLTHSHISTLYVDSALCERLPQDSCLMSITPLFKEMVRKLSSFPDHFDPDSAKARLIPSVIDELQALPLQPLVLTMPTDRRLRRMCERLQRSPAYDAPIHVLAKEAGLSSRHLMRLFHIETGMQFGTWRQQMRLMASLPFLADGVPVMRASQNVGYNSVAAFSTAFKRTFGTSPSQYFLPDSAECAAPLSRK